MRDTSWGTEAPFLGWTRDDILAMTLGEIRTALWAHRWLTLAVVLLAIGAAAALMRSTSRSPTGAATVQILVDSPTSQTADLLANPATLTSRATVFAQLLTSQAVLHEIAAVAHVSLRDLTAQGPYSDAGQPLNVITPAEARSNQLLTENAPYRLTVLAEPSAPIITASVRGPDPAAADRVANAVYGGAVAFVQAMQKKDATPVIDRLTLRSLGPAQSGFVGSGAKTLSIVAVAAVLILGVLLIVGIEAVRVGESPTDTRAASQLARRRSQRLPLRLAKLRPTRAPEGS